MEGTNNSGMLALKAEDGFEVQFDFVEAFGAGKFEAIDLRKIENLTKINDLNERMEKLEQIKAELDQEIERLTNHADKFDYAVSVGSGILAGLFDILVVGELDIDKALNGVRDADGNVVEKGVHQNVNEFIEGYAKFMAKWYPGTSDLDQTGKHNLSYYVDWLERNFPVAQDSAYSGKGIGTGSKNHHLTDLAHHPTPLGLLAAIMAQIFRVAFFSDKDGGWHVLCVDADLKTFVKNLAINLIPIVITGILLWLVNLAKEKNKEKLKNLPKPVLKMVELLAAAPVALQMLHITINWASHLISDMAGSKSSAGGGAGIPGLFVSLLEEISRIPPFNYTGLPAFVHSLYASKNNIFGRKIDFRVELAFLFELKRQSVPVIMNELIVRTFYFVRRLIQEIGGVQDPRDVEWSKINWSNVLPWGNRTITRMLTISSGTFMAVDMADAAIRAYSKSGGIPAAFFTQFLLRVNFVGIGRFVVALGSDLAMGYKRSILRGERLNVSNQLLLMSNCKILYYESNMWLSAEAAGIALREAYELMQRFCIRYTELYEEFERTGEQIDKELEHMESSIEMYEKYLATVKMRRIEE